VFIIKFGQSWNELFSERTHSLQSIVRSFVEQHSLVPSEITTNFAQIEPNITVVDNTHAIESVVLGTKDILQLDNLEVMVMAKNKKGEHRCLAQKGLPINCSRRPLHDLPPWST
jgi:hypothetical protein